MRQSAIQQPHTVYVGLSGGVDSSVAAALLQRQGYRVVGAFMRTWQPDDVSCGWQDEQRAAAAVAAHLGIPFETFNLEETYKQAVVDAMLAEYAAGRTPNPDVLCNQRIKFGVFRRAATAAGADWIATGHYARIQSTEHRNQSTNASAHGMKRYELRVSADPEKDQTYFLYQLDQYQLADALFPVGGYTKGQVREMARTFGLPSAEKRDSQGVCMLGQISMRDFLRTYLPSPSGTVLNTAGRAIGHHDGAHCYTVGQRRGFTITDPHAHGPHYVVDRSIRANTITVSTQSPTLRSGGDIHLSGVNWIAESAPPPGPYRARFRHQQSLILVTLQYDTNQQPYVTLPAGTDMPAAGQSLVLYTNDGDRCLGGGCIEYAPRTNTPERTRSAAHV